MKSEKLDEVRFRPKIARRKRPIVGTLAVLEHLLNIRPAVTFRNMGVDPIYAGLVEAVRVVIVLKQEINLDGLPKLGF